MSKPKQDTPKISDIFSNKSSDAVQPLKRTSSTLSPSESIPNTKKQNININDKCDDKPDYMKILEPLLNEFKSLRESVDSKVGSLEDAILKQREEVLKDLHKIETSLNAHKEELAKSVQCDIEDNKRNICNIIEENRLLQKENNSLKDRISQIETNQLKNNVIITGIPEQQWETYNMTKQHVQDTIASSLKSSNDTEHQQNLSIAQNTDITYCTHVGRYRPGKYRPISITFQKREDKELLMSGKSNLPPGLYVNHEYPPHVKKNCDRLRPILQLAKSSPTFKDKCKLENDALVLNGVRYTIDDISKLPEEIAVYKAAQKVDDNTLAFHREFSPFSNFHKSIFSVNHQSFHCAEQFIQYQKALMAGDSVTANEILLCETAYDAKRLSCKINGFNIQRWITDGYEICLEGIRSKFVQNPMLLEMLKSTGDKVIVEASTDKLWGTVINLQNHQVLNCNCWHSTSWMLTMLMDIRENT